MSLNGFKLFVLFLKMKRNGAVVFVVLLPYFSCDPLFRVQHYPLFSSEKKGRNSGKSRWIQLTQCRSVRAQSWANQLNEGRGTAETRM